MTIHETLRGGSFEGVDLEQKSRMRMGRKCGFTHVLEDQPHPPKKVTWVVGVYI